MSTGTKALLRRGIWLMLTLLCWAGALQSCLLTQAAAVGAQIRGISVPSSEVSSFRETEADSTDPAAFTLWLPLSRQIFSLPDLGRTASADLLLLDGDSALVLPTGQNLPAGDTQGCLLDRETAYRLFGDARPGGTLEYAGRSYIVRGVFDAPTGTVLLQGLPDTVYTMVALEPGADPTAFAARHQLSPGRQIPSDYLSRWAKFFAMLPAWVGGGALLAALLRAAGDRSYPIRQALLWIAAGLFVWGFLWSMRGTLPVSVEMLPTRWSDFEFWQRSLRQWQAQALDLFAMEKYAPDLFTLGYFFKTTALGIMGTMGFFSFLKRHRLTNSYLSATIKRN